MDCPVCKCPNPAGATHCSMCYEVFNRSAAQTYMQVMRRERKEKDEKEAQAEPDALIKSQKVVEKAKSVLSDVDWPRLAHALEVQAQEVLLLIKTHWKWAAGFAGLLSLWLLTSFLFSDSLWFHLLGAKLRYDFPAETPVQYLVGMKQNVKIWSERSGRLDTPMENVNTDEMGNVLFTKSAKKNATSVAVQVREWIQILHDDRGSASHAIPAKHPSLSTAHILLDKKGHILERRVKLSPRLGKGISFLTPRFPEHSLRHGKTWDEKVEWVDAYDDWQIYWSGTLHWTMGELGPCGKESCAQLTASAEIIPQLRQPPNWAKGNVGSAQGQAQGTNQALFDASHKSLYSHTMTYDGILRIPIAKLERIPMELRVGRRVKGSGEIVIRFENQIDVRKN